MEPGYLTLQTQILLAFAFHHVKICQVWISHPLGWIWGHLVWIPTDHFWEENNPGSLIFVDVDAVLQWELGWQTETKSVETWAMYKNSRRLRFAHQLVDPPPPPKIKPRLLQVVFFSASLHTSNHPSAVDGWIGCPARRWGQVAVQDENHGDDPRICPGWSEIISGDHPIKLLPDGDLWITS